QPPVDRVREPDPECRRRLARPRVDRDRDVPGRGGPRARRPALADEPGQLLLERLTDHTRIGRPDTLEPKAPDLDLGTAHMHGRPSSSSCDSGRSSFAYSDRAAASTWSISTRAPESAARNAALIPMLRMLPPATSRRASTPTSSAPSGVSAGNVR